MYIYTYLTSYCIQSSKPLLIIFICIDGVNKKNHKNLLRKTAVLIKNGSFSVLLFKNNYRILTEVPSPTHTNTSNLSRYLH